MIHAACRIIDTVNVAFSESAFYPVGVCENHLEGLTFEYSYESSHPVCHGLYLSVVSNTALVALLDPGAESNLTIHYEVKRSS